MDKNSLNFRFSLLAVVIAVVPVLAWGLVIKNTGVVSQSGPFATLMAAFFIYLSGLLILVYWFRRYHLEASARLLEVTNELQRRNAEMDVLKAMSEQSQDAASEEALLSLVMEKAMQVVRVRNGSIFLVDAEDPEGLRFVAAKPALPVRNPDKQSNRHSFVHTVIETGRALLISDIEQDPRTRKPNDPKYGSPSFISIPIYKNKKVLAVLNLANKEDGCVFTRSDERVLSILLGEVGYAVENHHLRKTIREQLPKIKATNNRSGLS